MRSKTSLSRTPPSPELRASCVFVYLHDHDHARILHVSNAGCIRMSSCARSYKHVANCAHPGWAYVLSAQIMHFPIALGESFLFCTIIYFMSGMTPEVSRWLFFVLCGLLSNMFMGAQCLFFFPVSFFPLTLPLLCSLLYF
jgi:hypothetical protein